MPHLVPFEPGPASQGFSIEAGFLRKSAFEIHLEFYMTGPIDTMVCPSPEEATRKDDLWRSTCLEAFLGTATGGYLEINCSPNGQWNAYEFDSYRQNMRPAQHITVRLTRLEKDASDARFFIQVISEKELALGPVGLCMVLETKSYQKSYWALRHTGPQADFHKAESWTLTSAPATQ